MRSGLVFIDWKALCRAWRTIFFDTGTMRSGPKVRLLVFLDGIESIESRDGRIGDKAGLCCEVSLVLIGLGPSSRSASRALRFWVSANNVSLLHLLQTDWRTHSLIFLVTAIALPVSRLSELLKRSAGQSHISISSWTYLDAALQQCYLRRLLARRL